MEEIYSRINRVDLGARSIDQAIQAAASGVRAEFKDVCREEFSPVTDALAKLREDCKESVQREVRSRLERETAMQEKLDSLRTQLETHSHEMQLEGVQASPFAAFAGGVVEARGCQQRRQWFRPRESELVIKAYHAAEFLGLTHCQCLLTA